VRAVKRRVFTEGILQSGGGVMNCNVQLAMSADEQAPRLAEKIFGEEN